MKIESKSREENTWVEYVEDDCPMGWFQHSTVL